MKTLCIIPAYNEEKTISSVIERVEKYRKMGHIQKIIVIDDCSSDKTAELCRNMGVDVVSHVFNGGYGVAQRTGHRIAIMEGYDFVIQIDGDGQHDPKYIPTLLKEVKKGKYDIVLGSRFLNSSYRDFSIARKTGIKFFTWAIRKLGHVEDITDITSGFKVYRVDMLENLSRHSDRHPAIEQMLEIAKKGFRIKEISVEMKLRFNGQSHLSLKKFVAYPFISFCLILKVLLFR